MFVFEASCYPTLLQKVLSALRRHGRSVAPRGSETLELEDVLLHITNPRQRSPILPFRNANIFALVAETMWVFSGRNDVEFLARYIPRITSFSDDGISVSGGYGPRLRQWHGVDQLKSICDTLRSDKYTRRAVVSLFDPERDHDQSRKDIPCNNWFQFTIRDEKLNLRVTSRSMDVIWGSALNVYEWTSLQELIASWLACDIGTYTHFIGSLHLYKRHYCMADQILSVPQMPYDTVSIPFDISQMYFDTELQSLIKQVNNISHDVCSGHFSFMSSWLNNAANLLCAHKLATVHKDIDRARIFVNKLPPSDWRLMADAFLVRHKGAQPNV